MVLIDAHALWKLCQHGPELVRALYCGDVGEDSWLRFFAVKKEGWSLCWPLLRQDLDLPEQTRALTMSVDSDCDTRWSLDFVKKLGPSTVWSRCTHENGHSHTVC